MIFRVPVRITDQTPAESGNYRIVRTAIATPLDRQNQFSELLEQHYGIVGKVARTYCWHPDDRDELSQEIITQLWRAFSSYDDTRQFSTWMYRVALNVSISWVRRNSIRQQHMIALGDGVHDVADPQGNSAIDDRIVFLKAFISKLDPLNRALMLLYLEERRYREIAEILGISETNVATKISRLKQRIRTESAAASDAGEMNGN